MHFCIAVKTTDKPAAKLARVLFVGLCLLVLVHACAHKPAAKPRRARASLSAAANVHGMVLKVTAAIHEGTDQGRRMTCSFPIEDWTSEEPATKKSGES